MLGSSGCHWTLGLLQWPGPPTAEGVLTPGLCSLFSRRDGKIGVHKLHSTFTVKYSAHEQEVNCVDCKGGIIVSGSRDKTAKVRCCPLYVLFSPPDYRDWGGRGWIEPGVPGLAESEEGEGRREGT